MYPVDPVGQRVISNLAITRQAVAKGLETAAGLTEGTRHYLDRIFGLVGGHKLKAFAMSRRFVKIKQRPVIRYPVLSQATSLPDETDTTLPNRSLSSVLRSPRHQHRLV